MLSDNHISFLNKYQYTPSIYKVINNLILHPEQITSCSSAVLLTVLEIANNLYRYGDPIISDHIYDHIWLKELKKRYPNHSFLNTVEPEVISSKTVELPTLMLSTDKAYTQEEIISWGLRIEKAAIELGIDYNILEFRITPKLDGYAAYDDGQKLYTRGDGRYGTDITRVFERGLSVANNGQRGLGPGEIVINKSYFDTNLSNDFDSPRNFQASIIKEKELNLFAKQAIASKAALFYPFNLLPNWTGTWNDLINNFNSIVKDIWYCVDYLTDGIVIEITNEQLKNYLGATRHHHRWQIAYKENQSTAQVKILSVIPQTSRMGRITPVAILEPTYLSGALISKATAHHYGMIRDKGIAPGAIIQLSRSGEVIPKIERVITPGIPSIPETCPSCGHALIWDSDYLICTNNLNCLAQITNSLEHFFSTLKNNDGFGSATINKLCEHNVCSLIDIYNLNIDQLKSMGFGPKQSENIINELNRSRYETIEDWRFLAAFGVFRMSLGNCEKLLAKYKLNEIFTLTKEDIISVDGFADKTALAIIEGFKRIKPLFDDFNKHSILFNIRNTQQTTISEHPLAGKVLVFTGTLHTGSRDELSSKAKSVGAKVGNGVSSKTDFLIAGDNVGQNKLQGAINNNVTIINEIEFLQLLNM